jgi:uncharacterized protein YcgI (DUF1989 family)
LKNKQNLKNKNKNLISSKKVIAYKRIAISSKEWRKYLSARSKLQLQKKILIQPRTADHFIVKAGQFFRICVSHGPQVGDLNLFNLQNLNEKFFSGKTRALYGTHLSAKDRLWSNLPYFRPMATITYDTLDWYGYDKDGASVHDVIGTRCDPYTNKILNKKDYHYCCHSNLLRSFVKFSGIDKKEAHNYIHDVLNVFMCTGFTNNTKQYFMKASPARKDDFIEFRADIDLLGVLSVCPGGNCASSHSSNKAKCYPLTVEIYDSLDLNNSKIKKINISSFKEK